MMDNPTTLLVAIMYVTIISIGLSNLLMTLSELAGGRKPSPDPVHLSWLLLLLVAYLGYYWFTADILGVEDWRFIGFAGFLIGPILLLFGTNLIIVLPAPEGLPSTEHYMQKSSRFFVLLALFNLWIVGLDFVTESVSIGTYGAALVTLFCFGLAASSSYNVQKAGAAVAWLLFLGNLGLQIV